MTLPLLILRPLDGARQTERRAKDLGLRTVVDPLFNVEPIAWTAPLPENFDGLLLTSANAVAHAGARLKSFRTLPVLAVGQATARAAGDAGFHVVETGRSSGQQLLDDLQADCYRRILWLAGEQHSALNPGEREMTVVPIYRSRAIALGEKAVACLKQEAAVLLHSARAARHLVAELERLRITPDQHHLLAFSEKVADAAGRGWKSLQIADRPDDESLLSLATGLCQSG
ncbi:uroporphyrinogen-III synthase [Sphingorhabdus sp. 109]|jgi:uroporphyrinogen-III synthase|uniref:uroporphyrinogen-III synthase n=1 Tax=Sphingorhabdus sp. 109 TaxID=2653173 RepID=UPI0012EFD588|nr:uroporphyrinogen-III synthase [Sphingorhabdus sp. 109]VWX62044.1 Uroporphyrinogen-III synthase [Sphingorhabdus sp. 109]